MNMSSSSEKKLVKLLKVALLGLYSGKNWSSMGHTQNQAQFFCVEITKGDHKLSRTFLFYQNNISFDWVMNDFVLCYNLPSVLAETDM